jgi:N-sulfoglucosamine sulfohydrolase
MLRNFLFLASLIGVSCFIEASQNVVFILADDMNRDSWGIYGNKDCKTPHIDRLAEEGVRFERAYCSVAMCAPFRQELYSGRSPWRTGTLPNHSKSVAGTKSIAHYLKPLGYRVALLGKSHVGPKECYPFEMLGDVSKKTDANPELLQRSQKLFDDCEKKEQPFCLFIASHDSHAPFTTGDRSAYDANKLNVPSYWVDTPELREEMVKYYAEVTNFDRLVGMIRTELEKRNLWENTIFIVCSEQGTQLPFAKWTCYDNGLRTGLVIHWPSLSRAGSVVEPLVSIQDIVPSLVSFFGGDLSSGDCDGQSFLSLLQVGSEPIHSYLFGAFTNCRINDNKDRIYPIRSIRDERYSLIYNPNFQNGITSNLSLSQALRMVEDDDFRPSNLNLAGSWVMLKDKDELIESLVHKLHHRPEYELYDLHKDPHELFNLAEEKSYQSVFIRLKSALENKLSTIGDSDPIATERSYLSQSR